jgi:hypothetical protein
MKARLSSLHLSRAAVYGWLSGNHISAHVAARGGVTEHVAEVPPVPEASFQQLNHQPDCHVRQLRSATPWPRPEMRRATRLPGRAKSQKPTARTALQGFELRDGDLGTPAQELADLRRSGETTLKNERFLRQRLNSGRLDRWACRFLTAVDSLD